MHPSIPFFVLGLFLSQNCLAQESSEAIWVEFKVSQAELETSKELGGLPKLWEEVLAAKKDGKIPLEARTITLGEHEMPFVLIRREPEGVAERALYICMHGGGQNNKAEGPHAWDINSREWNSQIGLCAQVYPAEGLFFVPRMADDRLGRWWHAHNQEAFDRVIEHAIREWGVDPDRVYVLGISEGAYGTDILAPFMADRFAGGNAMAGGVGDDVPAENLRNVAFRTDIGENDTMFDRVGLARKFHERLDKAKQGEGDAGGYVHSLNVQEGRGHGVDYQPGVAWMVKQIRDSRPARIVWTSKELGGNRRARFYWLGLEGEGEGNELKGEIRLTAKADREKNEIEITAVTGKAEAEKPLEGAKLVVLLDEKLIDLDKPVKITCNGKVVHEGKVERSEAVLKETLRERGDPTMMFPSKVVISL